MTITRTSTATTTTTTASDISQIEITELEIEPRPKSTDNNSCSCSSSSSSSLIPSNTTKSNHIHKPIARRNIPIELKDDNIDGLNPTEKENNMTKCIPNTKIDSSSSSTNSTSTPLIPSDIHRACKRSSSSSNDLIYERDRFRARLKSFNDTQLHNNQHEPPPGTTTTTTKMESTSNSTINGINELCEICDEISVTVKTAKLNIDKNPLDNSTMFYKLLPNYYPDKEDGMITIPVKQLNLDQVLEVFKWYFNSNLPNTKDMFPWLHGFHKYNFAQRSFFLHQQQQLQQKLDNSSTSTSNTNFQDSMNHNELFTDYHLSRPDDIRFLMCINDESLPVNLHNTVKLTEILTKIDVSKSEIKEIIKKIWLNDKNGIETETETETKTDSSFIELLVTDCIKLNVLPIFLNLDPERGISLRNFQIQVAKLSSCSDFIIYGIDELKIQSITRILWLAQRYERQQREIEIKESGKGNQQQQTYNIFVLKNDLTQCYEKLPPSTTIMDTIQSFAKYLKIDTSGLFYKPINQYLLNDYNLPLYEKIETAKMSSATKIYQNVWIGNFWDYQSMLNYLSENKPVETSKENLKDYYCQPSNSITTITTTTTTTTTTTNSQLSLPQPKANWKLFIRCHSEASFPDLQDLNQLLFKYTISSHEQSDEIHHLEFPPLGSIGIGDCKKENLQLIINTCKLIYLYSSTTTKNPSSGLNSLIYCTDGYTELSLLVFCYLMYSLNISLDEAILELHLTYGRPFYIFPSDVIILKKLQPLLRKFSPTTKSSNNNNSMNRQIDWANLEILSSQEINELLLGSPKESSQQNTRLGFISPNEDEDEDDEDEDEQDIDSDSSSGSSNYSFNEIDWVNEVEGSIPSKILPHIYLGSLKHALCLSILNKLGIQKIISVGESLPWLNGYIFQRHNDITINQSTDGNIETYTITPKKKTNLVAHSHHITSVDTVLKVNNLEDDGIDELSQRLPQILKFINDQYEINQGQVKILIHCRVGVSRSATVVIAEIMNRLKINLPMAYLYVRVRRLNIIIQPNLRFMYELFKWEEQKKLANNERDKEVGYLREIDWFIMCREITKLNTPYL